MHHGLRGGWTPLVMSEQTLDALANGKQVEEAFNKGRDMHRIP